MIAVVLLLLRGGGRNRTHLHVCPLPHGAIELRGMGIDNITAQGLPGIVGRDGWLARSEWTRNPSICGLPGITTAVRLDVHFW